MGLLDTEAMAEALRNWAPNGLLAKVYSSGDSAKRYVKGLLADPAGTVQQWMDQGLPTQYEAQQAMNKAKGKQYNPDAVAAYDQKHQALAQDSGLAGLTVWHGSPHKFSKFDMSKIGTGEGAQAYGHGLYMAESPQVAKQYADTLGEEVLIKGKTVYKAHNNTIAGDAPISNAARNALQGSDWNLAKARAAMYDAYKASGDGYFKRAGDELSALSESDITRKSGAMYKVDIPDEAVARMLDWDKPLSQQAPEVLDLLKKTSAKYGPVRGNASIYSDAAAPYMTGQDFYRDLANALSNGGIRRGSTDLSGQDAIASQHLKELGIPGIRYLDGGSRGTGSGTRNYVLFSDQLPHILETNGVPTGQAPWAPGEWQGLLQSQSR